MIFPLAFLDRKVVDAGNAPAHEAVLVKFPILVAVTAKPVAAVVMAFVGEAHGDTVVAECPDFLDQAVVELAAPFARQKCFDGGATLDELRAIAPATIRRVGECDPSGLSRVPFALFVQRCRL